ncbi:MAG: ribonuclease III [Lachnospiraceae bacterium]|nr:ribonuclease III [Lachnospiraceae bacterium]
MIKPDCEKLQQKMGYRYQDEGLLLQALTHTSFANEQTIHKQKNYERIEFLGDAVLEMVSSDYFYNHHPDSTEGDLTKMRAAAVCESALAITASDLGLGEFIRLGKGEEATGGRERASILSDVVEALIGSVYLDGGLAPAKEFIHRFVLNDLETKQLFYDAKSNLQELMAQRGMGEPEYRLLSESGPEHLKVFETCVFAGEQVLGKGSGRSKKAAQQQAATAALKLLLEKS